MAVIVPNGATNLSTVNGFYRAEAFNVGMGHIISPAGSPSLATVQRWAVTFANAGNCMGTVIGLYSSSVYADRATDVGLLEIKTTFTVTIASPAVVTMAGHGFSGGEEVLLETTGALPTGLSASTVRYYVKYIDANTFNLSLTVGGANINTSGTQSGTHTLWVTRTKVSLTMAQICSDSSTNGINGTTLFTPFEFATPYAVDTTAGKWRLYASKAPSTGFAFSIVRSDASNIAHVTWCDNAVSFVDNDTLVCKDRVTIDQTATIRGTLGTGDTVYGYAAIVCRSLDLTEDGISNLVWDETPAASYTFTVNGGIWLSAFGGMQIGSSTNPIPIAQRAIVTFIPATVGTAVSTIYSNLNTTSGRYQGRSATIFYGEIPTNRYSRLAVDAELLQSDAVLTEDLSAIWSTGDTVAIYKQNVKGAANLTLNTISSFTGATLTLNAAISTNKRFAGSPVVNISRQYGVELGTSLTSTFAYIYAALPIHLKASGVFFRNVGYVSSITASIGTYWSTASTKIEINDCFAYGQNTNSPALFNQSVVPALGIDVKRNIIHRCNMYNGLSSTFSSAFKSGRVTIEDNIVFTQQLLPTPGNTNIITYNNNEYYHGLTSVCNVVLAGKSPVVTNNIFWGNNSAVAGAEGALMFGTLSYKPTMSGNKFDNNTCAIGYITNGVVIEGVSKHDEFGQELANTFDFRTQSGILGDLLINDPSGAFSVYTDLLPETADGFKLRVANDNSVPNVDMVYLTTGYYKRCGDGLADTTVHTAGTDAYSLRFETIDNGVLEFSQLVPTGNIQNKDMVVGVWVKLNSANYWAGTHVMPTLTIDYDDGTIVTTTAAQTTDWQFIKIAFSPTTTFGQIKVTISSETDALTTDSYVYWDDYAILYPPGVQLNLGAIDIWSAAQPVTPTIATNVAAADVWNYPLSVLTGADTTGNKLLELENPSLLIGNKIII
jgi:hypothetical protein